MSTAGIFGNAQPAFGIHVSIVVVAIAILVVVYWVLRWKGL